MYRQIIVHPQDRNLQRILWRHSPEQPIQEYQLTTVTYGTSAAPFSATRHLRSMLTTVSSIATRVAQALSKIYIEDLLSGTTTMKKALQQLMGHLFRQRNQFSRGVQPAAGGLRHAAMSNPNNEGPGFLTTEGCNQNFIPPHAPHFIGLWEAAVKSVKHHLRRTLGAQIATYEELNTLLTEIEACLNSRRLCALPNDPPLSYLSPGHFLIGEPLTQLPTIDYSNIKMSRLSRWQTF